MRQQSGFSKFEFLLVVALVGILGTILLARMTALEAESERIAAMLTIRNIRSGLQMAQGEFLMRGKEAAMAQLLTANPLDFLKQSGEQDDGGIHGGATGNWQFDAARRELVYRPRMKEAFGGRDELRWRIEGIPSSSGSVIGLRLAETSAVPIAQ